MYLCTCHNTALVAQKIQVQGVLDCLDGRLKGDGCGREVGVQMRFRLIQKLVASSHATNMAQVPKQKRRV